MLSHCMAPAASMLHLAALSTHPGLSSRRDLRTQPAVMICAHAESMQRQGRWRKSVRAVIAVNSMRPGSKAASAAADAVQDEDHKPRPGQHNGSQTWHPEDEAAVGRVQALLWQRIQCRRARGPCILLIQQSPCMSNAAPGQAMAGHRRETSVQAIE